MLAIEDLNLLRCNALFVNRLQNAVLAHPACLTTYAEFALLDKILGRYPLVSTVFQEWLYSFPTFIYACAEMLVLSFLNWL